MKIHLKPSTPQSPAKDDRPLSHLTASESSDNSRPGSEGYDLPLTALPLPIPRGGSYRVASGYATMNSSDNDSIMFLPNKHHPRNNIPLSDTEVMHRRRQHQPNRHTWNKKPNHSATRSTHGEFLSDDLSPRSQLQARYGSQSNESFNLPRVTWYHIRTTHIIVRIFQMLSPPPPPPLHVVLDRATMHMLCTSISHCHAPYLSRLTCNLTYR